MIFVTVGTQLAFDRMIRAVDEWAGPAGAEVFAQVGPSRYAAKNIPTRPFLSPQEFDAAFERAELVIAHAGMGSILTALSFGKRIVIMPRRAGLGEHRNDHQLATANRFTNVPAVQVASDEHELGVLLRRHDAREGRRLDPISPYAPQPFIDTLRRLINE